MKYRLKTISEVRRDFWECYPCFREHYSKGKRQNDYNATIRSYFVGFVDCLAKSGDISESLADRVTL